MMLPSLEMPERSGWHEQQLPFADAPMRVIKLPDGSTLRAWP